jgi:hypothetical protein
MAEPELPNPFEPPPEKPDTPVRSRGKLAQWQMDATHPGSSRKVTALIVTVLLFVTVAGGLIALILLPAAPVEPYIVSIPIIEYRDSALPPNPWAERDAELLCSIYPEHADNAKANAQSREPFRQKLKEIAHLADGWQSFRKDQFNPDRPFILHICAHAATSGDLLYLLPADAQVGNPQTWVKVEEILGAIEQCPARKKLLILDLARPTANPFTGPLIENTTARLHELLTRYQTADGANRLPCAVLTSCSPGEISLMMSVPRVSAFAFYLAEGLRGAADGYASSSSEIRKRDERVDLQEVAAFVTARVQRWAIQNHGLTQTPVLYTNGLGHLDFALKLRPAPWDDPDPGPLDYAGFEALSHWAERDTLSPETIRAAGGFLARWEALLIQAEHRYATTGSVKQANDLIQEARLFRQLTLQSRPRVPLRYHSLESGAATLDSSSPPEELKALKKAVDDYLSAAATAPTSKSDPTFDQKRAKFAQAAEAVEPNIAALSVWRWALQATRPGRRDIPPGVYRAAAEAIRDLSDFSTEAVLLQAIALGEQNSRSLRLNPAAGPVKSQLLLTEKAASLALLEAPNGFLWARDLIDEAETIRQDAERKLFDNRDRTPDEYESLRLRLANAEKRFDDARIRMQKATQALNVAADALRVLSTTAYAAAEYDIPAVEGKGGWMELAEATVVLADLVCQSAQSRLVIPTADLVEKTERVKRLLDVFLRYWTMDEVKRRIEPGPTSAAGLRPLVADLTTPLLQAEDRKRVWDTLRQARSDFHKKTREEQDQPENESATTRTLPAREVKPVVTDPSRRARIAGTVFELAGYAGTGELKQLLEMARAQRTDAAWEKAAASLRTAWSNLDQQIVENVKAGDWAKADRALRVFPPGLGWTLARAKTETFASTARRKDEDDAFWEWRREHYSAYGAIRKAVPKAMESYQRAAEEIAPP